MKRPRSCRGSQSSFYVDVQGETDALNRQQQQRRRRRRYLPLVVTVIISIRMCTYVLLQRRLGRIITVVAVNHRDIVVTVIIYSRYE